MKSGTILKMSQRKVLLKWDEGLLIFFFPAAFEIIQHKGPSSISHFVQNLLKIIRENKILNISSCKSWPFYNPIQRHWIHFSTEIVAKAWKLTPSMSSPHKLDETVLHIALNYYYKLQRVKDSKDSLGNKKGWLSSFYYDMMGWWGDMAS